jgi:hypothetical protein
MNTYHTEDENHSRTKETTPGNQSTWDSPIDSPQIGRKVDERTRHALSKTKTLKELVFGHPCRNDFILKHGEDNLSSSKNDASNAIHSSKYRQIYII